MTKTFAVLAVFALLAGCAMPAEGVRTEADPKVAEVAKEQQRLAMRLDEMTKVLLDIRGKLDREHESETERRPAAVPEDGAVTSPVIVEEDVPPPARLPSQVTPPAQTAGAGGADVPAAQREVTGATPVVVAEPQPVLTESRPVTQPVQASAGPVEPQPVVATPVPVPPTNVVAEPKRMTAEPSATHQMIPTPAPAPAVVPAPVVDEVKDTKAEESGGEQVAKLIAPPDWKETFEPPVGDDPAASLFRRAYGYYRSGDFGRAILDFEEFAQSNPKHEYADSAQFLIGESYYQSGQFEQSIVEYNKVVEQFPGGRKAPEALYMMGESFDGLGQGERAKVFYDRLTAEYPSSEAALRVERKFKNP